MILLRKLGLVILTGQKVKDKNLLLYYDNNQKALQPRLQGERG